MKSLIAIVAGIVVSALAGWLAQAAGNLIVESVTGIEPLSAQGASALGVSRAPALLMVVVAGCFLGTLAGGYVAARLAPARREYHALAVGGFQMVFGVIQLLLFPHPVWFAVAILAAFPSGALLGSALSRV